VAFPPAGNDAPLVYFISREHLRDLDRHHDLLDAFDIGRLMRQLAWGEALPAADRLDLDRDGRISEQDLRAAVGALIPQDRQPFTSLQSGDTAATLLLSDGSTLTMPRRFDGRQTDFSATGNFAEALLSRHRSLAGLTLHADGDQRACGAAKNIKINDVFYRREPHEMRRYTALAFDNISRDPAAFAQASLYRMVRLFIVRSGTGDRLTTFQYRGSLAIFNAALLLSSAYFATFVIGVAIAWRRRSPFLYALIPVAYVPLTICFVLTNMRYTITVQPLMFVFVAMAVAAALRLDDDEAGLERGASRAGNDGR
jgi:hypothetical protein